MSTSDPRRGGLPGEPAGVVVVGAHGRLGSFALDVLEAAPDFHVAHALERGDDLKSGLRARLATRPATLALEATKAGLGASHGAALLAAGLRPVIATSGVTAEEVELLDGAARSRGLGGLVVPNFSLGMWLLQRFAVHAVRHLPRVEIIERHRQEKRDAPSGTAVDTAALLEAAGGRTVPIHSVRLPGLYAHQEVQLGGSGETLTIRHDMLDPTGFEPGILAALRYARTAQGVASGIGVAFDAAQRQA